MRAAMDQPDAVAIRPVRAADLDPITALQEASIMRLGIAAYGEAKARAWARVGYEFKHVLLGDGGFFVAERAGRTIGVGGWSPDSLEAGLAWIRYLFVHPDAAGRGIGRRLVEVAEASARSAGRHRFDVWSSSECGRLLRGARLSPGARRPLAGRGGHRARLRPHEQAGRCRRPGARERHLSAAAVGLPSDWPGVSVPPDQSVGAGDPGARRRTTAALAPMDVPGR